VVSLTGRLGAAEPPHRVGNGDIAFDFAHSMVRRFDIDWAAPGFSDTELDELTEHPRRIMQSLVIDPGRPPRTGEELRDYLRRWVGSAVGGVRR
jgi:hypothetical protein